MVVDSGPVRLAGRGERALVSVLALSPGRVIPDTTLIEQLWSDGDQPVDPVNALQTRVSKVRRALAAAGGGEPLTRHRTGYRLDVDPAGVDVHRFAALIDRARRAGAADKALHLYDLALAEWRAEPFVDFVGDPWAAGGPYGRPRSATKSRTALAATRQGQVIEVERLVRGPSSGGPRSTRARSGALQTPHRVHVQACRCDAGSRVLRRRPRPARAAPSTPGSPTRSPGPPVDPRPTAGLFDRR